MAACDLRVSREVLVLALGSESDLNRFAGKHGLSCEDVGSANRDGLVRAIDNGDQANAIGSGTADIRRWIANRLPIEPSSLSFAGHQGRRPPDLSGGAEATQWLELHANTHYEQQMGRWKQYPTAGPVLQFVERSKPLSNSRACHLTQTSRASTLRLASAKWSSYGLVGGDTPSTPTSHRAQVLLAF